MGVLNLTPDSFYDGNNNIDVPFLKNKLKLFKYCNIIDVGAASSRPYSDSISIREELNRLAVFMDFKDNVDKILSIDSYKPSIIKYAFF